MCLLLLHLHFYTINALKVNIFSGTSFLVMFLLLREGNILLTLKCRQVWLECTFSTCQLKKWMTRMERSGFILFTNIQVAGRILNKWFLAVSQIFRSPSWHHCSSSSHLHLLLRCGTEGSCEPHTDPWQCWTVNPGMRAETLRPVSTFQCLNKHIKSFHLYKTSFLIPCLFFSSNL